MSKRVKLQKTVEVVGVRTAQAVACKFCGHAYLEPCRTDKHAGSCTNYQWKQQAFKKTKR